MGGGIAQLASYGLADVYLTGSPQLTFWKLIYRRHTLFAMESIQQTFDGTADFGRKATVAIARNGDLVGPVWLEITVPDLLAYDISPTPPRGNTIDVTASSLVFKDPLGNYWGGRDGTLYVGPIGFLDPVSGAYYASATYTVQVAGIDTQFVVHEYDPDTGIYWMNGDDPLPAPQPPRSEPYATLQLSEEHDTWPYLVRNPAGYCTRPSHDIRWVNSAGHAILSSVEIEIGGSRIDKHTGEWLDIWSELSEKEEKRPGFWEMTGKYGDAEYETWKRAQSRGRTFYVPLRFCFNTSPGTYLPLVALSYHQVKYNFEFRDYLECVKATVPISQLTSKQGGETPSMNCVVFADYVFLDAPERIRMAESPHEYLITQCQHQGDEAVPAPSDPNGTRARKYALNFNHPVRELVWVYVAKSNYERNAVTGNNWFRYDVPGDEDAEVFDEARLVLNGHDRFSARGAPYFRLVQPYEHHTRCPTKRVHCYSFSLLSPEDFQPSGQANFSRFDTAQLQFQLNADLPVGKMKIYAYSFNVLRIAAGLAGLAFAN